MTHHLCQAIQENDGYVQGIHMVPMRQIAPLDLPTRELLGLIAQNLKSPGDILGTSKLVCQLMDDAIQELDLGNTFLNTIREEHCPLQILPESVQPFTSPLPSMAELRSKPSYALMTTNLSSALAAATAGRLKGCLAGVFPFPVTPIPRE